MAKWYLKNNPDKKVRLLTADGGGYAPFEDSGMIESGKVEVFNIINQPKSYALLMVLSEGYWPKWSEKSQKWILKMEDRFREETFSGTIGMQLCEGLTAFSTLWEAHLSHSDKAGFKHSFKFEENIEGGISYEVGGLQEGHFGMMQNELYKVINKGFNVLPYDHVVWTARVAKGKNRQGETEYGPKGAGQARTTEYPAWFMDCIHVETKRLEDGKLHKVAWFDNHPDNETGINYLAKVRILPEIKPKLYEKFPEGYMKLGFKRGLSKLFDVIGALNDEYRSEGTEGQAE
jgi:hypothetical protein